MDPANERGRELVTQMAVRAFSAASTSTPPSSCRNDRTTAREEDQPWSTHSKDGTSFTARTPIGCPGGRRRSARAKVLGSGDGYVLVLVEAAAGYVGDPHEHTSAEMSYVISGTVEHQGVATGAGDGYVAAAGSKHTGFTVTTDAAYVLAFKL